MTDLVKASVTLPAQASPLDPRGDWPAAARALRRGLLDIYGAHDCLPDLAGQLARPPAECERRLRPWNPHHSRGVTFLLGRR